MSVRLSVNISDDAAYALMRYRERHGDISATETIRRAIGLLDFVDLAHADGQEVFLEKGAERWRMVVQP